MVIFITLIMILLPAIILHECAHGWVANKLGDPTAKLMGRLTLNPLKHIDLVGSIILPTILMLSFHFFFGWAKPVPVNFARLNNPKKDMIWVALAGPGINILLAVMFSFFLKLNILPSISSFLAMAVFINLLLAVFNMIPIPPLDGSRIVAGLLPSRFARPYLQLERYGILVVFGLIYLRVFEMVILPIVEICGVLLGVRFS